MTRSRLAALPLLLLTGISSLGCTGTETGNPPRATVSLGLESSDDQRFSVGTGGAGVNITAARVGVQRLAFTKCSDQAVTPVAEGVAVDLRSGEAEFDVPQQPLCWVELQLASRDLAWATVHPGSSPELSFGLAGLTTRRAPLFIEDDTTPPVAFRPLTFDVTPSTELLLSLDVASALSFDEVEQLPTDNDGQVLINDQLNGAILANIRQRWASSWRLYAVDDSGRLELIATGEAP
jgi:hypothetical protein